MTATTVIPIKPTMAQLPGVQPSLPFEYWRIVPYDRILLYNFKDAISIEEAIALIRDNFDSSSIITARQLLIPITVPCLTTSNDTNTNTISRLKFIFIMED